MMHLLNQLQVYSKRKQKSKTKENKRKRVNNASYYTKERRMVAGIF